MQTPVNYGIVGVGGFGAMRRKWLRQSEAFKIVGGVDIRPEAFDEAERQERTPLRRYASVEALAADPEIEAVFISTPAQFHIEQALIASRAGKAVFVEKPLGHDLAACRELVEYCEKHNIPHGHGFSSRFADMWQYVKTLLDEGKLGQVISISASTMSSAGFYFPPDNWRFRADENPGGPLFQCGVHKLDLLRYLFGEGEWLAGYVNKTVTPTATDDAYVVLGRFGGIPTTFHSNYVASYRHAMEIYGTEGDLFLTEYPMSITYKQTGKNTEGEPLINLMDLIPEADAEGDALRDFAAAVRDRRQPKMNGREGLRAVELILEAVRISTPMQLPGFAKPSRKKAARELAGLA